jgi:hypothetical protein
MSSRRLDRLAAAISPGQDLEDYRVGSPMLTITTTLPPDYPAPAGHYWTRLGPVPEDEWWQRTYEGWCERYGARIVDDVIAGLLDGTLKRDPSRPVNYARPYGR